MNDISTKSSVPIFFSLPSTQFWQAHACMHRFIQQPHNSSYAASRSNWVTIVRSPLWNGHVPAHAHTPPAHAAAPAQCVTNAPHIDSVTFCYVSTPPHPAFVPAVAFHPPDMLLLNTGTGVRVVRFSLDDLSLHVNHDDFTALHQLQREGISVDVERSARAVSTGVVVNERAEVGPRAHTHEPAVVAAADAAGGM